MSKIDLDYISNGTATRGEDGNVYTQGRYKDRIIRGGKELSLVGIEPCLDPRQRRLSRSLFILLGLVVSTAYSQSKAVGLADELAAEVGKPLLSNLSSREDNLSEKMTSEEHE